MSTPSAIVGMMRGRRTVGGDDFARLVLAMTGRSRSPRRTTGSSPDLHQLLRVQMSVFRAAFFESRHIKQLLEMTHGLKTSRVSSGLAITYWFWLTSPLDVTFLII